MKKIIKFLLIMLSLGSGALSITSCSNDSDDSQYPVIHCFSAAADSQANPDNTLALLINSATNGDPTYHIFLGPRMGSSGTAFLDYMIHEPVAPPKNILLVLIAGGQLDASITGTGDGSAVSTAGINFLVRSAHLFAKQGYRVVTIDRPSDYADFLEPLGSTHGSALDVNYRVRVQHAVDLSAIINRANSTNQPVLLVGTSRGAISAVAQYQLGAAIAISSPVTSGSLGDPVTQSDASKVSSSAHVLWQIDDGCVNTAPSASEALANAFTFGDGSAVKGGFEPAGTNLCGAISHHGFLGIESCAVGKTTGWIDNKLTSLPTSRPVVNPVAESTSIDTQKIFDISGAAAGLSLTYSLPHSETSLGGTAVINPLNNFVTYNPPAGISGKTDTFVYVVTEAGGGTSHHIVSVTINP